MSSDNPPSQPSAPPLYPGLSMAEDFHLGDDFRLGEIRNIEKEISDQIEHYRLVLKKYKKVRKAAHYSSLGFGVVSIALSSGAVASSLSGVGIIVGAPVAGVAAFTGSASTVLTFACKKLERKVNKHSRLVALATAKHDSINSLVSRALVSNSVSDEEFGLITREMEKYRQLKENLRSRFAAPSFDIEKVREEVRKELTKKISN